MGKFIESEKISQINFKLNSPYFSKEARKDGIYKGKPRTFCLPLDYAKENLFPEIRQNALAYFSSYKIKWHDGFHGKPSNHLCDSQVCCVNFLFPFARKPKILADLFRPIFPNLKEMMTIENEQYIAFEWIGLKNYLGEKVPAGGKRTRGANYTSADTAIKFKRNDGKIQMVLIEWKYTESYGKVNLKYSKSGTDRTKIYRKFYLQYDSILDKKTLPSFDSLFYEPFYQFMRQQFLAHEMEKAENPEADIVSVLHIAPGENTDFHKITSSKLSELGMTAIDVWKRLLLDGNRFISISTEKLFHDLLFNNLPEIKEWGDYIIKRYSWV
jgi:hypothetical protein